MLDEKFKIVVSENEIPSVSAEISARLKSDVEAEFGPAGRQGLEIAIFSHQGEFMGGLRGYSHWKWLYITQLWVKAEARSLGLGARLINEASRSASHRGDLGLYVDTFSDSAKKFYEKQGFEVFGILDGMPENGRRFFLKRPL